MPEKIPITDPPPDVLPPDTYAASTNAVFQREMGHISRQSSVFFAGTIFTIGTGYIFKVYLARVLGAEALGIYALGMTVVGLVSIFNAFGLPQSAVRFVAMYCATGKIDRLRQFLGRGLFLLLVTNLPLGVALLLGGPWIARRFYHTPALGNYFGLFTLIMVLGAFTTFLGQVLAGYKDVLRRTVITNFIGSPVMMLLTVGLVASGAGLRGYIAAQVVSAAVVLGLLAISVVKLTPAGRGGLPPVFSPLGSEVVSFSALAFTVTFLEFLMAQSDKVLIGFYLSAREVGIYAVSMALVAFVPTVLLSINQIFSPVIADLHAREQVEILARIFQTLTKWSLGLTLPLAATMIIFAPIVMRIFGPDFKKGWPVLVIGTVGQLVNCGVGSVGYLLQMSGHQRELVKIQIVMALVMLGLSVALIPRWGILGAAAVEALTTVFSNIWYLLEVRRRLGLFPYNLSYFRLFLPLAGSVAVLFLARRLAFSFALHDWSAVCVAAIAGYLAFLSIAVSIGLDSDDRMILRAVQSRLGSKFKLREAGA